MILITGATGFIGTYLCEALERLGISYIGTTHTIDRVSDHIRYVDLTKIESLRVLDDYQLETVIHLASQIPAKLKSPTGADFFEINTLGTLNLINYLSARELKKVIFATSLYEVIEHAKMPITEDMGRNYSLTGDHALYVISKIAASDILQYLSSTLGFNLTILRFTGLIGYGRQEGHWKNGEFHRSAFETFYENATQGKTLEIWGAGNIKRDSLYVKDAVGAIIKALPIDLPNNITFNIASGVPSTVSEEVALFKEVFPGSLVRYIPAKVLDQKEYYFDITSSRELLGWTPLFDFKSIILDYHKERQEKAKARK